jgi:hypothetical protein
MAVRRDLAHRLIHQVGLQEELRALDAADGREQRKLQYTRADVLSRTEAARLLGLLHAGRIGGGPLRVKLLTELATHFSNRSHGPKGGPVAWPEPRRAHPDDARNYFRILPLLKCPDPSHPDYTKHLEGIQRAAARSLIEPWDPAHPEHAQWREYERLCSALGLPPSPEAVRAAAVRPQGAPPPTGVQGPPQPAPAAHGRRTAAELNAHPAFKDKTHPEHNAVVRELSDPLLSQPASAPASAPPAAPAAPAKQG